MQVPSKRLGGGRVCSRFWASTSKGTTARRIVAVVLRHVVLRGIYLTIVQAIRCL